VLAGVLLFGATVVIAKGFNGLDDGSSRLGGIDPMLCVVTIVRTAWSEREACIASVSLARIAIAALETSDILNASNVGVRGLHNSNEFDGLCVNNAVRCAL
jgi:hypothetical protein